MTKPVLAYGIRNGLCEGRLVLTMVTLAAVYALGCPVDAAAESMLEYAVFDPQAETLELVFGMPPAYGNLTLRPDGADSFLVYDIAERQNVLELNMDALGQFRSMTCPTLHVAAGSFVDAHGVPISNHTVPLWVVPRDGWAPPRPGVDVSCVLTYRIVESPLTPDSRLLNAVHDGLDAWSGLNSGLEMRHVETGTANISIEFGIGGALGEACTDCLYTSTTEWVYQECYGNEGAPNQGAMIRLNAGISDYNTLRDTAAHEFGHNLGLCHHHSPDHLMGKGASDCRFPYDNLGYTIPKILSEGANVIDEPPYVWGVLQCQPQLLLIGLAVLAVVGLLVYLITFIRARRRKQRLNDRA